MSYQKITPVAVIASFDSEGNIKPLYFRYKNERIQVSQKCAFLKCTILYFLAEYMIEYDNAVRTIGLLYKTGKHKWFIIIKVNYFIFQITRPNKL